MSDWRMRATCRTVNPETFFPLSSAGVARAAAVCGGCPVRDACRSWAEETRQAHGVWGGLLHPICRRTGCTRTATHGSACDRHAAGVRRSSDTCADGHPYYLRSNGRRFCPTCQAHNRRAHHRAAALRGSR